MPKQSKTAEHVELQEIQVGNLSVRLLGVSPLIIQRMTDKAKRQLLLPPGPKTKAEKASTLKHTPIEEFQDSPYLFGEDEHGESLLYLPAVNFKKSICGAAIDLPGVERAPLSRLVHTSGTKVCIFGEPKIFTSVVRSANMARTPDIRTRCIVPEWAAELQITFTKPIVREQTLINLMGVGGFSQGVGDWRPQKGSGNFGQYEIVGHDDERWNAIVSNWGRAAQHARVFDDIVSYDKETDDLLEWYEVETKRRGFKVA